MRRHHDESTPTSGATESSAASAGKRTRSETIQRRAAGAPGAADPAAPSASPTTGALDPVVQAKMEDAFDFDFSAVRVHEGGAAPAMGALAYTQGTDVHFAPGQYAPHSPGGQELIGHELAHVVQQSEGRVAATTQYKGAGLNDDAGLEAEADRWGAQAARGESIGRTGGGTAAGASGAIQRFRDFSIAGAEDTKKNVHWANGTPLRVAEDGTAAIAQAHIAGSQEMYVLESRLSGINAGLTAAKAPLILAKTAGTVTGATPGDLEQAAATLTRVKPVDPVDGKTDKTIPDDCGNAARTVTGAFAEGKTLRAEYVAKDGSTANATSTDPELMKYEIMVNHFGDKMPNVKTVMADVTAAIAKFDGLSTELGPYIGQINTAIEAVNKAIAAFEAVDAEYAPLKAAHDKKVAAAGGDATTIKALEDEYAKAKAAIDARLDLARQAYLDADAKWQALAKTDINGKTLQDVLNAYLGARKVRDELVAEIMGPYLAMVPKDQEAFDAKVGINRHANPDVGEAYTISSGGDAKPNGRSVWNFHWGGVIFKSTTGSDNITMENYAGSGTDEWWLQMYGVPTKGADRTGQTFHEQHRDTHGQHGQTPTTLATEKT